MLSEIVSLVIFALKALIIIVTVLALFILLLAIASKTREKLKGRLLISNLNQKLGDIRENLLGEILPKNQFKKYLKEKKQREKTEKKENTRKPSVFVLQFHGDMQASAVSTLREEITAILTVATPQDEVVVKLESGGGMVHGYGLAAAQLKRLRDKHIPLTVTVDKIAASGGYLMACVADRLLAAPFAIIGSIGVICQLPNFHRALQEKHIDFEQITAGNYKRTLTLFGKNTEEAREKLREELENIHHHFKAVIQEFRPQVNIEKVSTGEHWLAKHALDLYLIDELSTSDDYLVKRSERANVYEISSMASKFKNIVQQWMRKSFAPDQHLPIA